MRDKTSHGIIGHRVIRRFDAIWKLKTWRGHGSMERNHSTFVLRQYVMFQGTDMRRKSAVNRPYSLADFSENKSCWRKRCFSRQVDLHNDFNSFNNVWPPWITWTLDTHGYWLHEWLLEVDFSQEKGANTWTRANALKGWLSACHSPLHCAALRILFQF